MAWQVAAKLADLESGSMRPVTIADTPIALYHVEGAVYATHNVCTHAYALMTDGYLDGCDIECPLHQGIFDIRTGKALEGPVKTDLKTYPVKVEDGLILVDL